MNPISVNIEITQRCLQHCMVCSSLSAPYKGSQYDLACDPIIKSIGLLQDRYGIKEISLSGGEPLLHPDIFRIIAGLRKIVPRSVNIMLYTSGIIHDIKGNLKPVGAVELNNLYEAGLNKIIVDIYSINNETYNILTDTTDRLKIALETLDNAIAYWGHHKSWDCKHDKNNSIEPQINTVITKINLNEIEKILEFARSKDIQVNMLGLVLHGRALEHREKLKLTINQWQSLSEYLQTKLKSGRYKLRIGTPLCQSGLCECGKGKINIRYDGKIHGCEVFKNSLLTCESILNDGNEWLESPYIKHEIKELNSIKNLQTDISIACPIQAMQLINREEK